ncbi:MAG: hypothetical protein AVDCRST_MAG67-1767, partial [uncultured Solirubrobacteraceae bacterium]
GEPQAQRRDASRTQAQLTGIRAALRPTRALPKRSRSTSPPRDRPSRAPPCARSDAV